MITIKDNKEGQKQLLNIFLGQGLLLEEIIDLNEQTIKYRTEELTRKTIMNFSQTKKLAENYLKKPLNAKNHYEILEAIYKGKNINKTYQEIKPTITEEPKSIKELINITLTEQQIKNQPQPSLYQ